ncbi:MAG TPA: hypothetical protein VJ837_01835 [Candidatus Paceibacterota bacterium]|nr:hypothetical protein [Candidatus Paceibacterota bacterium]
MGVAMIISMSKLKKAMEGVLGVDWTVICGDLDTSLTLTVMVTAKLPEGGPDVLAERIGQESAASEDGTAPLVIEAP